MPDLETLCTGCKCYVSLYLDGDNAYCPICHTAVYKLINGVWERTIILD